MCSQESVVDALHGAVVLTGRKLTSTAPLPAALATSSDVVPSVSKPMLIFLIASLAESAM